MCLLAFVSLGYILDLVDLVTLYPELSVHVGDSALIGCIIQNSEGKSVTKVDWIHSQGQHGKVLRTLHCAVEPLANDRVG